MTPREDWPTTQPHEAARAGDAIRTLPLRFTGSGSEYFRIWIVNLTLTLVTFTLYWPFARARRLAYFQGNTLVGKDPLSFHGDPWKMFRGYLFMLVVGGLTWWVNRFAPGMAWMPLLAIGLLWPALWLSSMRFRLRNTSWRGVRMAFLGSTAGAYAAWLPLFAPGLVLVAMAPAVDAQGELSREAARQVGLVASAVALLVLLLGPWALARLKRFQHGGFAFARERTRLQLGIRAFYGLALRTLGMVMLAGAVLAGLIGLSVMLLPKSMAVPVIVVLTYLLAPLLVWPWFTARAQNLLWNHTWSARVRFSSDLSFERLAATTALNWLFIVLTLGLYWPFAQVRLARLRLEAVSVDIEGDVNAWLSAAQARQEGALGDAAGDFFGMDMGL